MRTKLDFGSGTEQFAHEKFERAFQIGDADVFIDIKAFDLMKLRAVGCVEFIAPIRGAGRNHANRRRRGFHRADLHG